MAFVTIGLGLLLTVLGLVGYFGSKRVSKTALIPTFFGVPLVALGLAALRPSWESWALIGAVVLAALGFLGSARGLVGLGRLLSGGEVKRRAAAIAQSVMALLCLAFLVLALLNYLGVIPEL